MPTEYDDLLEAEAGRLLTKFDGKDKELREELSKHGLGHFPLTSQTKKMLIRKLATKLTDFLPKEESSQPYKEDPSPNDVENADVSLSECSSSFDDQNKTHYAICIPGADDQIIIVNDRMEVLKKMKEHTKKKPRMLMFSSYTEAEAFAKRTSANDVCQGSIVKTNYPKERAEQQVNESLPFPSVGIPQLNQLRVLLEKGNVALARELILNNPRHLISNGDIPTILKIGPRYNALHSCAFVGQLESSKIIMELLCDIEFLKSMYGTQQRAESHSKRLVDLYLNTPDKLAHKTPLHFASEKGFVELVAFLVSFKACNRTARHQEIACDKYKGPDKAEIKKRIQSLIKDGTCYVPFVRSDTTGPYAKVVKPFSPSSPHHLVEEIEESLKPSPADTSQDMKDFSNLKLWAVAGPMSPQEAQDFRRDWWSPRARRKEVIPREPFLNITDGERGFEHYGRKLADSHDVPWQEYWPFLDAFVDMRCLDGLKKLENHLLKQTVILKYESYKTQAVTTSLEPLRIGKDFILEIKESEKNEDSESFVSANDFESAIEEHKRLKETLNSFAKDDTEEIVFHDCEESLLDENSNLDRSNHLHESSFKKIWDGISRIKALFSPGKKKSVPENLSSGPSPITSKGTLSASAKNQSSQNEDNGIIDLLTDKLSKDSEKDGFSSKEIIASNTLKTDEKKVKLRDTFDKNKISKTEDKNIKEVKSSTSDDNNDTKNSLSDKSTNQTIELSGVSSVKHSEDKERDATSFNGNSIKNGRTVDKNIIEAKSSISDNENDTKISLSDKSPNQIIELSAVCEISSVKPSEDREHNPTSFNDNSIETGNCVKVGNKGDAPRTSTPVKEWSYRESVSIINSPDELSNVHVDADALDRGEEKEKQDLSKEMISQHSEKSPCNEEDESFRSKMSFLCHGLEEFRFQSPPCTSPADTFILDDQDSLRSSGNKDLKTPCLHIFAELDESQFIANIEKKLSKPDSDVKKTISPILMLRQADDCKEDCVLADVYLPLSTQPSDPSPLMDETEQKDVHGNVWLNFIVSFPTRVDANCIADLQGSHTFEVKVQGVSSDGHNLLTRDKQFDLSRLKEAYFNARKCETESTDDKNNCTLFQCKVIRSSAIPTKDVYIYGTIPTKIDGDVYRALNDRAVQLIENTKELSAVSKWFNRMKMNGKNIESLPSPSHLLRSSLQQQGSLPLSPLVKNPLPVNSQSFVQSPCSSKASNKDLTSRKLFPTK